jgi:hypothetical protein
MIWISTLITSTLSLIGAIFIIITYVNAKRKKVCGREGDAKPEGGSRIEGKLEK